MRDCIMSNRIAGLAQQQTRQFTRLVDSKISNAGQFVRSGIAAKCRLGHRPRLDGRIVHHVELI